MATMIGYVRVGTVEQAVGGVSLAAQEAKIRAYCDLYDIDLSAVVVDAGESAKSLDRPGIQRVLAELAAGEAGGVVVLKLDRLTRSVRDLCDLIDLSTRQGWAMVSVSEQLDTRTAAGRMVVKILATVSEWEREAIGERTSTALRHLQAQGTHVGRAPFGYRIEAGKLVRVEAEWRIVELVREWRAAGRSLRAIAAELNERGIPTQRGGRWAAQTVKNVLQEVA